MGSTLCHTSHRIIHGNAQLEVIFCTSGSAVNPPHKDCSETKQGLIKAENRRKKELTRKSRHLARMNNINSWQTMLAKRDAES
jgi:hypothetical protein